MERPLLYINWVWVSSGPLSSLVRDVRVAVDHAARWDMAENSSCVCAEMITLNISTYTVVHFVFSVILLSWCQTLKIVNYL